MDSGINGLEHGSEKALKLCWRHFTAVWQRLLVVGLVCSLDCSCVGSGCQFVVLMQNNRIIMAKLLMVNYYLVLPKEFYSLNFKEKLLRLTSRLPWPPVKCAIELMLHVYTPWFYPIVSVRCCCMPALCCIRQVLQMENNELLTSIKWNLSETFWQTDIVGKRMLVLQFEVDCCNIRLCSGLFSALCCFVSNRLNQLTYYGNEITHLWIWLMTGLAWTVSILARLGIVNTASDTLIRFIRSENLHLCVGNWDCLIETAVRVLRWDL